MSHSPSPPNNSYHKDERSQRQHNKLQRKLQTRHLNQVHQSSRNNKNSDLNGLGRSNHTRNGTSSGGSVGGGASSVGTSDDGEESSSVPDEEDDVQPITDFLSSVESPIIKEITSRTALITWEAPQPTTENSTVNFSDLRYEILLGDRGKDGKYKSIFKGTALSCKIQDLIPGKEYHVCLTVHYLDSYHGLASEPTLFKTPPCEPDQPLPVKLIIRTKNSLQLRWNAPADNGSHIIHYMLECNNGMNGEFVEVCKTKSKQFTLNKLQPSTPYAFRLAALNECGRSEYSDIIHFQTAGNPPSIPQAPLCTKTTSQSLTLVWTRRREDGEYVLQMNDYTNGYMNVYVGPENIYECARLLRGTKYQFRLRASNEAGSSSWSDETSYRTLPECPGRPSKPQVKGKIHANSFKVRWDPPLDRGGAEINSYHLEISSGAVFERIYSGPDPEAICDQLSPGTTYQIRVICEGPGGVSISSDICTVTTEAIVPNPPQTPFCNNPPGPYAAVLRWEKPHYQGGAPVNDYEMELEGVLNEGAERKKQRTMVYRGKESCCVVKDLLPGESYLVRVRAINRIGAGSWSEEFTFKAGSAPPNKPQAPEINVRSPTHLFVQWKEPQCNGSAISDYKLESSMKQNEENDGFSVVYEGVESNADLKDLLPFTTYHFRLFAFNSAGRSPYSPVVTKQTPAAPPSVPAFQTELFEVTANTAHLFWKEPENNGSQITHYLVEYGDRTLSTKSNDTNLLIDHLSPEQMYKVKVQAVNSIGSGQFSQLQKIFTKPLPPKPPKLECMQFGYNSLKLKWGNDSNSVNSSSTGTSNSNSKSSSNLVDFQRFYLDIKIKNSSKDYHNIYTGTRNSIKVQKLHESTLYSFRICAQTDHAGIGPYSDEYVFKTQACAPNSVKITKLTENNPVINSSGSSHESHVTTLPTLAVEWQHSKNNHFNDAVEYILQKAVNATGNIKNQQFEEVSFFLIFLKKFYSICSLFSL